LKAEALADAGQLTDAMRLDPLNDKYVRQAALLAQSRAARGRDDLYERALAYWDRVEKIRPTHPGTPYNRGMIFRDVGKPTEAIAALRRSRELAPTWPKAIIAQAQLHDELGEKDQALAAYGRVNELSESPLLLYRAIDTDLDPSFAWAWLAIADSLPESDALPLYDRSGRYLRRLLAANRAAEARLRMSGDWEYRQSPDVVRLCQEAARRHLVFDDPGPRLRAALLLVDAGSSDLAEKLFVSEGDPVLGPNVAGELLEAWSLYVAASHRRAQARTKPDLESAHRLMAAAGARIDALLQTHSGEFDRLRDGAHGWTDAEYGALNQAVLAGKSADEAMNTE
ncbi:MAG TPA: hypothetical protein QGH10_02805, partial [Armatimonadota bacterium]|nr:hypothetical protein [Armatimonadota bacterium]